MQTKIVEIKASSTDVRYRRFAQALTTQDQARTAQDPDPFTKRFGVQGVWGIEGIEGEDARLLGGTIVSTHTEPGFRAGLYDTENTGDCPLALIPTRNGRIIRLPNGDLEAKVIRPHERLRGRENPYVPPAEATEIMAVPIGQTVSEGYECRTTLQYAIPGN